MELPDLLNEEEETKLLLKSKKGDLVARELLIMSNIRLVIKISKKYYNLNLDYRDSLSVGIIGLIKGVDTYKIDKCYRLSSYLYRCIDNEYLMYHRKVKKEFYLDDTIYENNSRTYIEDIIDESNYDLDDKLDQNNIIEIIFNMLSDYHQKFLALSYGFNGHKPHNQLEMAKLLQYERSNISRIQISIIKFIKYKLNIEKHKNCPEFSSNVNTLKRMDDVYEILSNINNITSEEIAGLINNGFTSKQIVDLYTILNQNNLNFNTQLIAYFREIYKIDITDMNNVLLNIINDKLDYRTVIDNLNNYEKNLLDTFLKIINLDTDFELLEYVININYYKSNLSKSLLSKKQIIDTFLNNRHLFNNEQVIFIEKFILSEKKLKNIRKSDIVYFISDLYRKIEMIHYKVDIDNVDVLLLENTINHTDLSLYGDSFLKIYITSLYYGINGYNKQSLESIENLMNKSLDINTIKEYIHDVLLSCIKYKNKIIKYPNIHYSDLINFINHNTISDSDKLILNILIQINNNTISNKVDISFLPYNLINRIAIFNNKQKYNLKKFSNLDKASFKSVYKDFILGSYSEEDKYILFKLLLRIKIINNYNNSNMKKSYVR